MEMNFTELDNNQQEEYNDNYWTSEATKTSNTKSKKKVSYDDILTSLNMVVQNGVLQFAKPVVKQQPQQYQQQQQYHQQQQQYQQQQQQPQNSYIHNKYFQVQQHLV